MLMTTTTLAFAQPPKPVIPVNTYPALNIVHYQASVEKWVTTQTALVTVNIDASLNQAGMDNLQQQVNTSLTSLANNVNWQMIAYNRNEDASGLEQVSITEQARLSADQLANLRSKTTALSKPGIKYSINDIEFTPSMDEVQTAEDQLRAQLYQRIKQEIDTLNKTYNQNFYVNDLEFYTGNAQPMMRSDTNAKMMLTAMPQPQAATTMSQQLIMSVDVTLAATIKTP